MDTHSVTDRERLDAALVKIANGIYAHAGVVSRRASALDQLEAFVLHNRADIKWTDDSQAAQYATKRFVGAALHTIQESMRGPE